MLDGNAGLFSAIALQEAVEISAYLVGVTQATQGRNAFHSRLFAEALGTECEHRVLARSAAAMLTGSTAAPNNVGFEAFPHRSGSAALKASEALGLGFGKQGATPGNFYEYPGDPRKTGTAPRGHAPAAGLTAGAGVTTAPRSRREFACPELPLRVDGLPPPRVRGNHLRKDWPCLNISTPPRRSSASSWDPAHKMETKLVEVLEELEQAAQRDEIKQALREHREQTRQHAMNIEKCFSLLGEDIDDSPCPVIEAMAKEGKATIKKTDDSLVDAIVLVAATESEHYEIAVYETLVTNARARGETQVAELLQENLDQDTHALEIARSTMNTIANQGIAVTST